MNCSARRHVMHTSGFTLVEVLVVSVIVMALAAILYPVVDSAIERSHQGDCLSNQKQLALTLLIYTQDSDGLLPLPADWVEATDLPANSGLFDCPSTYKAGTGLDPDYGMNAFLYRWDAGRNRVRLPLEWVKNPANVELTSDLKVPTGAATSDFWRDEFMNPFPNSYTVPGYSTFAGISRHGPGVIVSFLDGHVALLEGRAMGTQDMTPYNIPPGYGRVSLNMADLRDQADARTAMQTFTSFAATWMASGGEFNEDDNTWDLTDAHLMTSAEGQTYDKNCAFNGASNFGLLRMEIESTPGARLMAATPNDFTGMVNTTIPSDPATRMHEKMTIGWQTIYYIDTANNSFHGGFTKALSDQDIYSGYTPNTWADLTGSPAAGSIQSMPDATRFTIEANISFKGGAKTPFPTDPGNKNGWVLGNNYGTGSQRYQNVDVKLSSSTGIPFVQYNGPYIANSYTAGHYGRILIKVIGGTVRVKKIYWAPSL